LTAGEPVKGFELPHNIDLANITYPLSQATKIKREAKLRQTLSAQFN